MSEATYKDVLLISEDFLKNNTTLDWNLSGKYLLSAVKAAQDIELRSIIGRCLLEVLQQKVFDKEIDKIENLDYKDLLDTYIMPFLCYQSVSETIIPVSYKISNFGLMNSSDEKDYAVDNREINLVRQYYTDKANVYKRRLQNYLCKNKSKYPELDDCCEINLYASDSCGIWLGGYRGKVVEKDCCGGC